MISHRRANRRYVLVLLVLTAVTLITLDNRRDDSGASGVVGRGAHALVSPIERAVDAVASPISDWFDGIKDGRSLKAENRDLRERLGDLEDERRRAKAALEQNKTYEKLLGLPILDDVPRVTARVVNRTPSNFEWTVTLDKGEETGISPDMVVLGPDGLVGRVLDSWRGGAKVLLLVDPESNVGVRVLPGLVSGIAEGVAGSKHLRVELDNDVPVAIGDEVVTSGLENSSFPEGLSVGRITKVDQEPGGLGTVVEVEPWSHFAALEYVTVLRWVPGQGAVVAPTTTVPPPTTAPGPAATPAPVPTGSTGDGN
jgi:rod shape-determining protein MreC